MTLTQEVMAVREHQATMKADLNWVKQEQEKQNKKLDNIGKDLTNFINTADNKYANKKRVDEIAKKLQGHDVTIQKYSAIIGFVIVVVTIVINILF